LGGEPAVVDLNLKPLLLLLALALLFFWAVGAHSRLVQLRRRVAHAVLRLTELLDQRATAQAQLQTALQRPLAAEHGALLALNEAHNQAQRAAKTWAARPIDGAAARDWSASERPLASCAARVLALLDQHAEVKEQADVAQPLAAWQQAQDRLPLLRQSFNDSAATHDRALAQFPTRLLTRVFRFSAAGRV
jgi:LemA protein